MVAGILTTRLPEMVAGYHRAAVFMQFCISFCTLRVIWTTGQWQTYNLPSVLVEQNQHRFDFRRNQLERFAHHDGLEHMLLFVEFLTRSRCLTSATVTVVDPRLGIGPSLIGVPRYFVVYCC